MVAPYLVILVKIQSGPRICYNKLIWVFPPCTDVFNYVKKKPSCSEWLGPISFTLSTRGCCVVLVFKSIYAVMYSHKMQALIFSSGTFWQCSPCACGAAGCELAVRLVQCIPPCNKLLVQVSLLWASSWPGHSRDPHKEALYESDSQAPWEEAWPHFEFDTLLLPRQQGAHLFHHFQR